MTKLLAFAIIVILNMTSGGYSQEVPAGIIELMENYTKDSTFKFGLSYAKKWLHLNDSIQLKDLKIGRPVQEFRVKYPVLDTCSDTASFNKIIEAKDHWHMPVMVGDQALYELELTKTDGKWRFFSMGDLPTDNMWTQLQNAYPESSGINPVLVVDGISEFFYFKQKGIRKIYYIRPGYQNDSLERVLPGSINSLNDSKELIKHWKRQGKGKGSSNNTLDKIILRHSQKNENGGGSVR